MAPVRSQSEYTTKYKIQVFKANLQYLKKFAQFGNFIKDTRVRWMFVLSPVFFENVFYIYGK